MTPERYHRPVDGVAAFADSLPGSFHRLRVRTRDLSCSAVIVPPACRERKHLYPAPVSNRNAEPSKLLRQKESLCGEGGRADYLPGSVERLPFAPGQGSLPPQLRRL